MINSKPLVSVILPTFNRALTLPRAIDSVLNQTYKNLELIIIDDGSTDNTLELLKNYQKVDKRVKVIFNKQNLGAPLSRNKGIKASNGDYIAFQDSDDEWLQDKLITEMGILLKIPDVGLVYSLPVINKKRFDLVNVKKPVLFSSSTIQQKLLYANVIDIHVVVKKQFLLRAGLFDIDLPRFQDWELWLRLSSYATFACTNQRMFISYLSRDSISTSSWNHFIQATNIILTKHQILFNNYPQAYAKRLLLLGDAYLRAGKSKKGLELINKSLSVSFQIKALLVWAVIKLFGIKQYLKISSHHISYITNRIIEDA